MPGWALLLGTLVYNYSRHRRGLPTICATTRRLLPRPVSTVALGGGYLYLAVHVWRGYPRLGVNATATPDSTATAPARAKAPNP